MNAIVAAGDRIVIVTLWIPRTALASSKPGAIHGVRASRAPATSSMTSPDGSATAIVSSPNRSGRFSGAYPAARSRDRHASSEPAGTENVVAVIWPAPFVPMRTPWPRYGNVVQIVPGVPRSSP